MFHLGQCKHNNAHGHHNSIEYREGSAVESRKLHMFNMYNQKCQQSAVINVTSYGPCEPRQGLEGLQPHCIFDSHLQTVFTATDVKDIKTTYLSFLSRLHRNLFY